MPAEDRMEPRPGTFYRLAEYMDRPDVPLVVLDTTLFPDRLTAGFLLRQIAYEYHMALERQQKEEE